MLKSCMKEKKSCLLSLKLISRKLQRGYASLSQSIQLYLSQANDHEDVEESIDEVPDDVKEGHFAVIAAAGGEPKRFIVELDFLSNPCFLRLLELAEAEYGFEQPGTLTVPCRPEVLDQLLKCKNKKRGHGKLATNHRHDRRLLVDI